MSLLDSVKFNFSSINSSKFRIQIFMFLSKKHSGLASSFCFQSTSNQHSSTHFQHHERTCPHSSRPVDDKIKIHLKCFWCSQENLKISKFALNFFSSKMIILYLRCGNQIGAKFWEVVSDEHGIDPTG